MATFLSRLGAFSARHRTLVLVVWGLMLATVVFGTVTGLKFSDGGFTLSSTESGRALQVMQREEFPATAIGRHGRHPATGPSPPRPGRRSPVRAT